MSYRQLTPEDRYTLSLLRMQGCRFSNAEIARMMGRHRSTIGREFKRNSTRLDGAYRYTKAQERTNGRRSRSRRNSRFTAADWTLVETLLAAKLSPEQISGLLRSEDRLRISYETIYQYIWRSKRRGGKLHLFLRQPFKRRKRYASKEKRGRLPGKRHISERPPEVELRKEIGHWEMDTIMGSIGSKDCAVTLVERVTGVTLIGKLRDRSAKELNRRVLQFIRKHPELFKTITVDNGTEFHSYKQIEKATGVLFYFATPYHSWERGTNENTNGLIRQYLPKRRTMSGVTQRHCTQVARSLNNRPRKRHGFASPIEKLQLGMAMGRSCPSKALQRISLIPGVRSTHVSVAVQT